MHSPSPAPADFRGARVLLSGASGYLAGRLLPRLLEGGAELLLQTRHPEALDAAAIDAAAGSGDAPPPVLLAGAPGQPETDEAIRAFAPQVVFGLAGRTDATPGPDNETAMQLEHVRYAAALADAVAGPELRRLVYTGSCAEYGNGPVPFREDQRARPSDPYARAKHEAVELLRARAAAGLPVCVVRPFVVYGPGQSRGLVHAVLGHALADRAFPTTEGTQTRDLVWADDVVDGLLAAAVAPGAVGEVINLGSGVETPVREVIEALCRLAGGGRPDFGAAPRRAGEVLRSVAAIGKARALLDWRPGVALEDGLARLVEAARAVEAR